jgi:hypothetical protein
MNVSQPINVTTKDKKPADQTLWPRTIANPPINPKISTTKRRGGLNKIRDELYHRSLLCEHCRGDNKTIETQQLREKMGELHYKTIADTWRII